MNDKEYVVNVKTTEQVYFTQKEFLRTIGATFAVGLVIGGGAIAVAAHFAPEHTVTFDGSTVEQCPSEDYTPESGICVWDATTQGNGDGESFIVNEDGSVIQLGEFASAVQ